MDNDTIKLMLSEQERDLFNTLTPADQLLLRTVMTALDKAEHDRLVNYEEIKHINASLKSQQALLANMPKQLTRIDSAESYTFLQARVQLLWKLMWTLGSITVAAVGGLITVLLKKGGII